MPIYEYRCETCGEEFEKIVFGKARVVCPGCRSKHVKKKASVFGIGGDGRRTASSCGSCRASSCKTCGRG